MLHKKKVLLEHFQRILNWDKKYELRLADWECAQWDILLLAERDPITQQETWRVIKKRVTHVLKTKDVNSRTQEDIDTYGFQILSFE